MVLLIPASSSGDGGSCRHPAQSLALKGLSRCWIHTCAVMQQPEDTRTWPECLHRSQGMTCSVLQPGLCQQMNQTAPRCLCRLETAP